MKSRLFSIGVILISIFLVISVLGLVSTRISYMNEINRINQQIYDLNAQISRDRINLYIGIINDKPIVMTCYQLISIIEYDAQLRELIGHVDWWYELEVMGWISTYYMRD